MTSRRGPARLPVWARCLLAVAPARTRGDVVSDDLSELFLDRRARYGALYAHRRLCADILSLRRDRFGGFSMGQDIRFALRLFRKHWAPASIAISGLAITIGVVTAAFSVVNASMLRPYGMDDPATVVSVAPADHSHGWFGLPYRTFLQMREQAGLPVEAFHWTRVRLGQAPDDDAAQRAVAFVSGGYMELLGGRPTLGRSLGPSDDRADAAPVVVLSHALWQSDFSSDPAVLGRTVWLDGAAVTVVGVVQPGFTGPEDWPPSIWAPLASIDDVTFSQPLTADSTGTVKVVARLTPDMGFDAAKERLGAIATQAEGVRSAADADSGRPRGVRVLSVASPLAGDPDTDLVAGLVAAGLLIALVMLLASANTANLLLAAAVTRMREVGVRLSLGATRARIVRQHLTEAVLLAGIAGAGGFALAGWLVPLFTLAIAYAPEIDPSPDWRVLAFTMAVSAITGVGAGLAPARYGAGGSVLAALREGQSAGAGGHRPTRLRTSLVGLQAAASMLLLLVTLVLTRSALVAIETDVGFAVEQLVIVNLEPRREGIDHRTYLASALEVVRGVPAVENATVTRDEPFGFSRGYSRFVREGRVYEPEPFRADAGFFDALGLQVTRGRSFTEAEAAATAPVVVISETFAREYFGDTDPVGRELTAEPRRSDDPRVSRRVVGVVGDAVLNRLDERTEGEGFTISPIDLDAEPSGYSNGFPMLPSLLVRSRTPGAAARAVRDALRVVDPGVRPSTSFVQERVASYLEAKGLMVQMIGPAALLSLLLATLGIYGVTAFAVGQRGREISIRMAIGATAADVRRQMLRDSLRPVLVGLAAGLFLAVVVTRVGANELAITGISPNDPLSVGVSLAVLLGCATLAAMVPARRAASADPVRLLRAD